MSDCSTHAFDVPLKPCPFCGGEARVYEDDYGDWRVYCRDGLTYGCLGYWTVDRFYPTKAEAIAAWNTRAERTCECVAEHAPSPIDGKEIVLHRCSACHELMRPIMPYCPNCGAKAVGE